MASVRGLLAALREVPAEAGLENGAHRALGVVQRWRLRALEVRGKLR